MCAPAGKPQRKSQPLGRVLSNPGWRHTTEHPRRTGVAAFSQSSPMRNWGVSLRWMEADPRGCSPVPEPSLRGVATLGHTVFFQFLLYFKCSFAHYFCLVSFFCHSADYSSAAEDFKAYILLAQTFFGGPAFIFRLVDPNQFFCTPPCVSTSPPLLPSPTRTEVVVERCHTLHFGFNPFIFPLLHKHPRGCFGLSGVTKGGLALWGGGGGYGYSFPLHFFSNPPPNNGPGSCSGQGPNSGQPSPGRK